MSGYHDVNGSRVWPKKTIWDISVQRTVARVSCSGLRELQSTMMTSNRPLEDWGKLIGDVPAATAILNRFLQQAELVEIKGKSYRLRNPKGKPSNL